MIDPVIEASDIINSVDIAESSLDVLDSDCATEREHEFGCRGKILAIGGESGSVQLIDLKGRSILNSVKLKAAVNVVRFFCLNLVLAGTESGALVMIRIPEMKIVGEIHDSESSIQSIVCVKHGFLASKYDGAVVWYGVTISGDQIQVDKDRIILTGSDVDPVYSMASDSDFIYTASRDGCIRKYDINEMFH